MNDIMAYHCVGDRGGQPLHCHEEVELVAVYRGRGKFQAGRTRHDTGPGVFSVACPQEPHGGTPADADFAVKGFNVSIAWFAAMGLDWRLLWRKGAVSETPAALTLFFRAHEVAMRDHSRLALDEALLTLYALMRGTSLPQNNLEPTRVHQAAAILQDRFAENISLAELAEGVGLSPAYLCRAFTKTLGLPPHAYQISLRVARAKTLLANGTSPAHAAHTVGFYDQSHLNLHYKRLFGETPARAAKSQNLPIHPDATRVE